MADVSTLGAGTLVLFFAFAGAEAGLNASGEITHPLKTVPRGVALGMSGILLLYLGLQTVAQGVLGPELARNTEAPLAAVARAIFGDWGGGLLFAASVMSIYATLSGDMLGAPRVVFASARDGHLPAFLAKVHHRVQDALRVDHLFRGADLRAGDERYVQRSGSWRWWHRARSWSCMVV